MIQNQLLISVPLPGETIFEKIVVYVCEHSEHGAVGLIINQPTEYNLAFVFEQLGIDNDASKVSQQPVLFGGPVQQDRGFVIHRPFQGFDANLGVNENICISTSQEILRRLASGAGPEDSLVTLGYAGWAAEELDEEIKNNYWLTCSANEDLMYNVPYDQRWQTCVDSLGLDISKLVTIDTGHA